MNIEEYSIFLSTTSTSTTNIEVAFPDRKMDKKSEAWISGDRVAAFDSFDSDTTMDNDTTENTSDAIVQDVDINTMTEDSDSITTMANSVTNNDTTDDLSESTDDFSTTTHSISITCCPSPSSSDSTSSDSTTGSTTSTPHCILKPTHFSSTSPLIRRSAIFPRPEWAGVKLARQKSDQEQRVFAKKQCVRFCGDEEEEDGGDEERQEEEEEEEEKGEGRNWGLEPQRRNQDRREGGTFMESFWRVGDEDVCGVEA
ncbi:hypothetical protein D6C84_08628 [Aureobasidium pullulans]|uniref:Uncharacterized protein n=1 Tax=Aureobasidium pullulans TaxID=5580 RepID=A0A4S9XE07_AURPU|nr:hypothetical protein D6C84_08628 [Aureobasidium pullulans]